LSGVDPAHGGEVAVIRGAKWRERKQLEREWEREHGLGDQRIYRAEILPGLRALPTRRLVDATGMTRAYCAKIRRGELVPHARHWDTLRAVAIR
jgi:hypothetical protein